jgi:hypothetical protein
MKQILLSLFLICALSSIGQKIPNSANKKAVKQSGEIKCETIIKTETDKVQGTTSRSTKEMVISKDGKYGFNTLQMLSEDNTLIWAFVVTSKNVICIETGNKINILFRDGSRLEMQNMSDYNCGGKFNIFFQNGSLTMEWLSQLKSKEIETIRIWDNESYEEQDLSNIQSKTVLKGFQCLSDLMKAN